LMCLVAGVVVDIFCTVLFDATYQLGVPAYVYLITSAAMCALLLRSPALDEEVVVEVEFEQMEGGVDVPGLPPGADPVGGPYGPRHTLRLHKCSYHSGVSAIF
jgi:hypothetical protein